MAEIIIFSMLFIRIITGSVIRGFFTQKAGPNQPVANLVHLFQFAETSELPATKYTQGETALRHHQQHRIRVILKNEANRTQCV